MRRNECREDSVHRADDDDEIRDSVAVKHCCAPTNILVHSVAAGGQDDFLPRRLIRRVRARISARMQTKSSRAFSAGSGLGKAAISPALLLRPCFEIGSATITRPVSTERTFERQPAQAR